jgi:hypothetical protein
LQRVGNHCKDIAAELHKVKADIKERTPPSTTLQLKQRNAALSDQLQQTATRCVYIYFTQPNSFSLMYFALAHNGQQEAVLAMMWLMMHQAPCFCCCRHQQCSKLPCRESAARPSCDWFCFSDSSSKKSLSVTIVEHSKKPAPFSTCYYPDMLAGGQQPTAAQTIPSVVMSV